jgi:AcrR family transcriptional regulator
MPALADVLGVTHPALYYYFTSKQTLIDALATDALTAAGLGETKDGDWRTVVIDAAISFHDVMRAWLPPMRESVAAFGAPVAERIAVALISAGWTSENAIELAEVLLAWSMFTAMSGPRLHTVGRTEESLSGFWDEAGVAGDSPLRLRPDRLLKRDEFFVEMLNTILDTFNPSAPPRKRRR